MHKLSVSKELFQDILLKKTNIIEKEASKYWLKELLEPKIENDKIKYNIKDIDKLIITNGLGQDKPQLTIECERVEYSFKKDFFQFHLGKILEQKNSDLQENYKDNLIEELLRQKAQLEESMHRDHLTGVYNRRKMESDLSAFTNQNNSYYLCAIFIDADRFKGINDNFGHDTGDRVLIYLGKKFQKYAKILNGEVYRYGGEEFVILCFMEEEQLKQKVESLRIDIKSQRIYHPKRDISITISMGVSFYKNCTNKDELIKKADIGVYKAKNSGRDKIVYV